MRLYPLLLKRHLDSRIWGGQRLAHFLDLAAPFPERIAESWQVFDANQILNGPLAGRTLAQVAVQFAPELIGTLSLPRYGADFPLLAKFIDARQDLSLQVHPDDAYARRVEAHSGYQGKNEAWYILDAEPGANIFYHLAHPVAREEFENAVRSDTPISLLNRRPVASGQVIYVPAGTLHTINAGIMLFEIQQKSDLTYRVYDYGRPRPLHLEKALDVIAFDRPPPFPVQPLNLDPDGSRSLLVACQFFAMERWRLGSQLAATTRPTSVDILTLISGAGELGWHSGRLQLKTGESVVLPASLGPYTLNPLDQLTLLRCYVPDLEADVRRPLQQLGYSSEQIAGVIRDAP